MKEIKRLIIGLMMMGVVACSNNLTPANLLKIETGMTRSEVAQILGKPTKEETSSTLGMSGSTMIYKRGGSIVKIILLNDKVISKSASFK